MSSRDGSEACLFVLLASMHADDKRPAIDDAVCAYHRLGNCWFVQCLAGVATRKRAIEAMIYPGKCQAR